MVDALIRYAIGICYSRRVPTRYIIKCIIFSDSLNFLDVMPELEYLNLSFNKLTTLPKNVYYTILFTFQLDLSNNRFTHLSSKLFNINVYNKNVSNLKYLINLQGNPFICNCSLQWMLNELIPKLYITDPSLLEDLRCAKPPELANKRMIHWYKWKGEVFCDEFSHFAERMIVNTASISSKQIVTFKPSSGMITALITLTALLGILMIIGMLLIRKIKFDNRSTVILNIINLPMTRRYPWRWIFPEFGQKGVNVLIITRLTPGFIMRTIHNWKYTLICASTILIKILHHAGWYQCIRQTGNKQSGHHH
ncbi:Leucine-rich repeat and fibronectin type-III domain-containing protein 4 [Cyphomyrmex costatus]|uniref:Leucine-rich repeat and fibronectin type-III domain-containing protein 4 n=1 Tax=Cyphomyrmex costatus TaxID=456900 RepID=A0A195D0Q6_9HYME|nr:Leucine-rich repeat and fibronectin type-III domain-containing protein 4 [Cyphomyrmex costatus]